MLRTQEPQKAMCIVAEQNYDRVKLSQTRAFVGGGMMGLLRKEFSKLTNTLNFLSNNV